MPLPPAPQFVPEPGALAGAEAQRRALLGELLGGEAHANVRTAPAARDPHVLQIPVGRGLVDPEDRPLAVGLLAVNEREPLDVLDVPEPAGRSTTRRTRPSEPGSGISCFGSPPRVITTERSWGVLVQVNRREASSSAGGGGWLFDASLDWGARSDAARGSRSVGAIGHPDRERLGLRPDEHAHAKARGEHRPAARDGRVRLPLLGAFHRGGEVFAGLRILFLFNRLAGRSEEARHVPVGWGGGEGLGLMLGIARVVGVGADQILAEGVDELGAEAFGEHAERRLRASAPEGPFFSPRAARPSRARGDSAGTAAPGRARILRARAR